MRGVDPQVNGNGKRRRRDTVCYYIDASDPTTASTERFINDPGPQRKPNVAFVLYEGNIRAQTLAFDDVFH